MNPLLRPRPAPRALKKVLVNKGGQMPKEWLRPPGLVPWFAQVGQGFGPPGGNGGNGVGPR